MAQVGRLGARRPITVLGADRPTATMSTRGSGDYVGGTYRNGAFTPTGGWQAWFEAYFPGETLSHDMLAAAAPDLARYGVQTRPNAEGRIGKLEFPGLGIVDVVQGGAAGLNRRQFLLPDGAPGTVLGAGPIPGARNPSATGVYTGGRAQPRGSSTPFGDPSAMYASAADAANRERRKAVVGGRGGTILGGMGGGTPATRPATLLGY